jgi:hypothetical protein
LNPGRRSADRREATVFLRFKSRPTHSLRSCVARPLVRCLTATSGHRSTFRDASFGRVSLRSPPITCVPPRSPSRSVSDCSYCRSPGRSSRVVR